MLKIAIRADGGPKIGMGHITRCLALAEEFTEDKCEITFITKYDETVINLLTTEGFKSIILPDLNKDDEISYIKEKAKEFNVLVTDSYGIDFKYLNEMKKTGVFLVTIDDLNSLESYPSDIVINGNIYAEDLNYKSTYGQTKFLLGPKYILLRKEFRNIPQRELRKKVEDVLITMGGSDPKNLTLTILEQLINLKGIRYHVAIGPGFSKELNLQLKSFAAKNNNVSLYENLSANQMCNLMLKVDIAISAGGSTLYELAATGTPTIAVIAANNQIMNVKKMYSLNMVIANDSINTISNDVNRLMDSFSLRKKLCSLMQGILNSSEYKKIIKIVEDQLLNINSEQ